MAGLGRSGLACLCMVKSNALGGKLPGVFHFGLRQPGLPQYRPDFSHRQQFSFFSFLLGDGR
jgi:hypothetical protein